MLVILATGINWLWGIEIGRDAPLECRAAPGICWYKADVSYQQYVAEELPGCIGWPRRAWLHVDCRRKCLASTSHIRQWGRSYTFQGSSWLDKGAVPALKRVAVLHPPADLCTTPWLHRWPHSELNDMLINPFDAVGALFNPFILHFNKPPTLRCCRSLLYISCVCNRLLKAAFIYSVFLSDFYKLLYPRSSKIIFNMAP